MSNKILGGTYKDKITGFRGVATGYVEYLTGCSQVLLIPPVNDKGEVCDGNWFDVQRLERDEAVAAVVLDNGSTPGCDMQAPKRT